MFEPINQFFYSALSWINSWVGNWGWAMIVFTIMIRLVLTPLDFKSRVSMRKTQKLQPQLAVLQKKYANDKEKLNQKTAELYKKAHVNPLSSCLPLLLTWPILICVFTAMRMAANAEMLKQVGQILNNQEPAFEGWMWIKNLWMPDNVFSTAYPDSRTLALVSAGQWKDWFEGLKEMPALLQNTDFSTLSAEALSGVPETLIESIKTSGWTAECFTEANYKYSAQIIMGLLETAKNADGTLFYTVAMAKSGLSVPLLGDIHNSINGYIILPILSMVSQIVMTKVMSGGQPQTNANGQSTGKMMQYFFPVFSLILCFNYSSAFALYWVAGNLVSMGQTFAINKYLDNKEKKAVVAGEGSVK